MRTWLASYVLLALACPSLGPLPWVVGDFAHERAEAHEIAGHSSIHHHYGDASDIPGSPTHPVDHNCFECVVLKHLSRCVVAQQDPPTVAALAGTPVQPRLDVESQQTGHVAALPPARGPPLLIG